MKLYCQQQQKAIIDFLSTWQLLNHLQYFIVFNKTRHIKSPCLMFLITPHNTAIAKQLIIKKNLQILNAN